MHKEIPDLLQTFLYAYKFTCLFHNFKHPLLPTALSCVGQNVFATSPLPDFTIRQIRRDRRCSTQKSRHIHLNPSSALAFYKTMVIRHLFPLLTFLRRYIFPFSGFLPKLFQTPFRRISRNIQVRIALMPFLADKSF